MPLFTNLNSKWVQDFNVRSNTLKVLEKKVEKTLQIIGTGKHFMNSDSTIIEIQLMKGPHEIKKKICTAKDSIT